MKLNNNWILNSQKVLITLFIMACIGVSSYAQSPAGLSMYAGVSAMYNQDQNVSPNGDGQYGYLIGADARLNSDDLYFSFGLRYIRTSIIPEESMSFFSNTENYNLLEGRFGLGFNLLNISGNKRLRSKLMLSMTRPLNNPKVNIEVEGYEKVSDSWGSVISGIGMDLGALTIDLEYQLGLTNAYKEQKESKINALSFAVGFFF